MLKLNEPAYLLRNTLAAHPRGNHRLAFGGGLALRQGEKVTVMEITDTEDGMMRVRLDERPHIEPAEVFLLPHSLSAEPVEVTEMPPRPLTSQET